MPKLTDQVRADRRRHVLESAWTCFSRDGFHATTMDDVIAATGWSSSAVYRYVRSKDELIEAAARESLSQFETAVAELAERDPAPTPAQALAALAAALEERAQRRDYDLTRIVVQSWSEALRNPAIAGLARSYFERAQRRLIPLAEVWKQAGYLPGEVDAADVATSFTLLAPVLVMDKTVLNGTSTAALLRTLLALGRQGA